jgi:hypothetical protein
VVDYLLIESRLPTDDASGQRFGDLGIALARAGNRVRLLLLQDGVLAARPATPFAGFNALLGAGVSLLAEVSSLQAHGIAMQELRTGVRAASLEIVLDALEAGARVVWH